MQPGGIKVRVLFFGVLKEQFGGASDLIELTERARVRDVLAKYEAKVPALRQWLPSLAIAVNQQYANPDTELKSGDEVALLPPVSGGSSSFASEGHTGRAAGSPRHASIVRDCIDSEGIVASLKSGDDGAIVVFEGTVRHQTRGRKTLYLDYEAYEPMALGQMESLATQALEQFQIRDVALAHRLGRLEVGETSVLIVVVSAHRAAAFDACRWLIDTLKRVVPIWKKEHFADGAVWADGEPFPAEISRANSPSEPLLNSSDAGSPTAGSASK
jgi:molybdopterin converting factor subunit 1